MPLATVTFQKTVQNAQQFASFDVNNDYMVSVIYFTLSVGGEEAHPAFQGDECGDQMLSLQSSPRRVSFRSRTAWRRPSCSSTSWGSLTTPSATRWSATSAGLTASTAPTAIQARSSSRGVTRPSLSGSGTSAGPVAAASTT